MANKKKRKLERRKKFKQSIEDINKQHREWYINNKLKATPLEKEVRIDGSI